MIKPLIMLALLACCHLSAAAQQLSTFREPWEQWQRKPLKAQVILKTKVVAASGTQVAVSLAGSTNHVDGVNCSGFSDQTLSAARIQPYTKYTLTATGSSWQNVEIQLVAPVNRMAAKLHGTSAVPKPYKLYVNGVEQIEGTPLTVDHGSCGSNTSTWEIEARPHFGFRPLGMGGYDDNWRQDEEDVSQATLGSAFPLELGPGLSAEEGDAGVRWALHTGRLLNGTSAGLIRLQAPSLTSNVFNASMLQYTLRSTNTAELLVVTNGSGVLRQIKTPQTLVDIQATNGLCELGFHPPGNVGLFTNGLFLLTTNSPLVRWQLKNPSGGAGNATNLQVLEIRGTTTNTQSIVFHSASNLWTLTRGAGSDLATEARSITVTNSDTLRLETVEIRQGANLVYRAVETYEKQTWGWELAKVVSGQSPTLLTNEFEYYTDPNDIQTHTRLKQRKHPTGRWEKWVYPGDLGEYADVERRLSPWKDAPADPASADVSNSFVTRYATQGSAPEQSDRMVMEYFGSGLGLDASGDALGDYSTNQVYFYTERSWGKDGDNWNYDEIKCEGGKETQQAKSTSFWRPGHSFDTLPRAIYFGDGRRLDLFDYFKGSFNWTNLSFSTHTNDVYDFVSVKYHGTWSYDSVNGSPDEEHRYFLTTSHGDYGDLVLLKSTREVEVYQQGNLVFLSEEVFSEYDTLLGFQFSPIGYTIFQYDHLNQLTNRLWMDASNTNHVRTEYSASFVKSGQILDRPQWQLGEDGTRLDFNYDSLGRMTNVIRLGVTNAALATISTISTNWTHDAVGRPLTERVSSGSLALGKSFAYDVAGRLTLQSGHDGIATNLTYRADNLAVTNTTTGGATLILEHYLDGRLKSVTGNSIVPEYYDYFITTNAYTGSNPWAYVWEPRSGSIVRQGSPSSPRWSATITDLARRLVREEWPDSEGGVRTRRHDYVTGGSGNQPSVLAVILDDMVDAQGEAKLLETYFWYDSLGRTNKVVRGGEGSAEYRTTYSSRRFQADSSAWFDVDLTLLADPFHGATHLETVSQKLNGHGSTNQVAETHYYDADENLTIQSTHVDRSGAKLWEVLDTPQSNLNGTNIHLAGLLVSSNSTTVDLPDRHTYDGLGRMLAHSNPLGFQETRAYDSLGRVQSFTDFKGASTTLAYYPTNHANAGLVYSVVNPLGKASYFAYDALGRTTHKWGDVPYPERREYDATYGDLSVLHTYQGGTGWGATNLPGAFSGSSSRTWFAYNLATGLLTNRTDAATNSVAYTYYPNGLERTRRWARGVVLTNFYTEFGELARRAYSDSTPAFTATGWTGRGDPTWVTQGDDSWTLAYDPQGRLTSEQYRRPSLPWDGHDLLLAHSPLHGLTNEAVVLPALTNEVHFGHDARGRLGSLTNGSFSLEYTRLPGSERVQQIHHRWLTNTVGSTRQTWEYGYRLRSVLHVAGGVPLAGHSYIHDALDRRTRRIDPDGAFWLDAYNDRDEVVASRKHWPTHEAMPGGQFAFGYDNIGNRLSASEGGDATGSPSALRQNDYSVNSLNQITGRDVPEFIDLFGGAQADVTNLVVNGSASGIWRRGDFFHKLLAVGNATQAVAFEITTSLASGGATNTQPASPPGVKLLPPAWETFDYDADGNLVRDGLWHYVWDAENRLIEMTNVVGLPPAARLRLVFEYDWRGRRTHKRVHAWDAGAGDWAAAPRLDRRWVWHGWLPVAEVEEADGALASAQVWGLDLSGTREGAGGIGGLAMQRWGDGQAWFHGHDGNGNLMASWNGTNGAPAARYEHDPFGRLLLANEVEPGRNAWLFSTKYRDAETGLLYYGYRHYSPELGRWLSRDPIEEEGGLNLYGFAGNNGINRYDLLGLYEDDEDWELDLRLVVAAEGSGYAATYAYSSDLLDWHNRVMEDGKITLKNAGKEIGWAAAMNIGGGIAGNLIGKGLTRIAKPVLSALSGSAAKAAIGPTGKTVLGSFPGYLHRADQLGARRFNIPTPIWQKMTKAEQWAANQKFLDRMIARGDKIILSNDGRKADAGTSFKKELEYLISKGFKLAEDGMSMVR